MRCSSWGCRGKFEKPRGTTARSSQTGGNQSRSVSGPQSFLADCGSGRKPGPARREGATPEARGQSINRLPHLHTHTEPCLSPHRSTHQVQPHSTHPRTRISNSKMVNTDVVSTTPPAGAPIGDNDAPAAAAKDNKRPATDEPADVPEDKK